VGAGLLFVLIIGGLVAIVAALSADLVWLVVIIAPFWLAVLVWGVPSGTVPGHPTRGHL